MRPQETENYLATLSPERATFHRLQDEIATNLEIAVSTEDDVEVRRLSIILLQDECSMRRCRICRHGLPRRAQRYM